MKEASTKAIWTNPNRMISHEQTSINVIRIDKSCEFSSELPWHTTLVQWKECTDKKHSCVLYSGYSELLATCAFEEIRIWHTLTGQELCRYTVSNMTCNAICITRDGRSIFSGKYSFCSFVSLKNSVLVYSWYMYMYVRLNVCAVLSVFEEGTSCWKSSISIFMEEVPFFPTAPCTSFTTFCIRCLHNHYYPP